MIKNNDKELGYRVLLLLASFLILYVRKDNMYANRFGLLIVFYILFLAVFNTYLPFLIGFFWRKLGSFLSGFMSPIILVPIYFLIFVPISFFSRFFVKQNPFKMTSRHTSFTSCEKMFDGNDLKNLW